ncbi:ribosomal RNA-processing protein 7-domain-containing protein [Daedaleopsis nitida]|nr:ribosomal RNA-processing protein 7-domain-containing protein [Daedaleopsis nitida]
MGSSSSPAKSKRAASGPASSSIAFPTTISGFTVLPIAYSSSATHIVYARAHAAPKHRDAKGKQREELPEGRTLFLVNVPPDATDRELTLLFKSCGTVERVVFSTGGSSAAEEHEEELGGVSDDEGGSGHEQADDDEEPGSEGEDDGDSRPKKKRKASQPDGPRVVPLPSTRVRTLRRTGHTAYVVFLDGSSLTRALKPPQKPHAWPADSEAPLGLAHYTALHAALRPPLDLVRAHADSWMDAFEHAQAERRQESEYRKGEAVVDEDGFTLVTRGAPAGAKRHRKKKEKQEKDAFYAFQIHEKKRKDIIDLKKKFEEDKAKIEKLKESRKFRPY